MQHAWAPALVKVVAAIFVAHLLGELLFRTLPALRARWRRGERLVRRETDRGRGAVLADPVLAAANWGIVPEPGRALTWVERSAPAAPRTGLRALTLAERRAHPAGPVHEHLRILDAGETRTRRLRLGNDPALVVSCWSDAASAKKLDSEPLVTA